MRQILNIVIFLLLIVINPGIPYAAELQEDTLSFFKRFSFHANAMDWLLATTNIGMELDFTGTPRSHYSLFVDGKYNWNTRHSTSARIVYNIGAVRVEARKYWRTGGKWEGHRFRPFSSIPANDERHEVTEVGRDTTVSWPRWAVAMFRRNVISGRTFKHPRSYRAYYAGIYAGYEKFTYSFGRKGFQGDSYNFGLSGGWSVPLYYFRYGHSLDLDLGLAVGAKMLEYDKFRYEEETGCYVYETTEARHFLPYPMLQELRLGLVFRFRTIGRKVQGGAERYEIWEDSVYFPKRFRRERKRYRNWELSDSMRKEDDRRSELLQLKRDSLREDRLRADSLEQVLKALDAQKRKTENAYKDSLENVKKEAEKEERRKEKEKKALLKKQSKELKKKKKEEERQKKAQAEAEEKKKNARKGNDESEPENEEGGEK